MIRLGALGTLSKQGQQCLLWSPHLCLSSGLFASSPLGSPLLDLGALHHLDMVSPHGQPTCVTLPLAKWSLCGTSVEDEYPYNSVTLTLINYPTQCCVSLTLEHVATANQLSHPFRYGAIPSARPATCETNRMFVAFEQLAEISPPPTKKRI